MNKMLQVRSLSASVHRRLKARAALEGMTLSDYVGRLIERDLEKPSMKEWLANLQTRPKVHLDPPPEDLIRQDRDSR
jgi:plasmid stability protein